MSTWPRSRDVTFLPMYRLSTVVGVSIGNLRTLSEWVASISSRTSTSFSSRGCVTDGQILPSLQLAPESASMAGGGPDHQGNNYTHNDAAFVEYNTRLQSSNLPTFTSATSKFTEWLGSDKAYYPNARVPVRQPSRPPRRMPLIVDLRLDRFHYRGMPIIQLPSLS